MQDSKRRALIWLRNDLRITDHYGFYNASKNCDRVIAYYTFDPKQFIQTPWGFKKTGKYRLQFLIETLKQLKSDLLKKNISLIIDKKNPEKGIPKLVDTYGITDLYYQKEWTQEEQITTNTLKKSISEKAEVHSFYDQFLFHPDDLPIEIESLPEVFTVFRKKCEKFVTVRSCFNNIQPFPIENTLIQEDKIPSLEDFDLLPFEKNRKTAFPFIGGSKSGKQRIDHYFWETEKILTYKHTRNGLTGEDYSSKLSAWLANGSLSAREIYWEIKSFEKERKKNQSTYWLVFELIWRDFFKYISLKHGNKIFKIGGILDKNYNWNKDKKKLQSWINGSTDESFVNANMIELLKTGWMSNRGRQNVASYFAKELLMDWRMGAAYFESQLIDYDVHSNYGNWMYISGVGNDPRDRKFDISWQAQKYDSQKKFQNLWLK
jgi:deoxyribodipyrimidine photo-lyase